MNLKTWDNKLLIMLLVWQMHILLVAVDKAIGQVRKQDSNYCFVTGDSKAVALGLIETRAQ